MQSDEQVAKKLRSGQAGGYIQRVAQEMDAALAAKDQKLFVDRAAELKRHIGAEALAIYLKRSS
jgi:hypothetical protein